ncbi:hypothetical protein [Stigmatella aurantiaca]|uniref:Conserved uncharacterized protein n=1 Tax=Stigmatella aurantiaca (strain DW4/3-1) TaxID=378806 RepID=Q08RK0_STIAD|nr:hypothetical protein [Stigmatella aurantiaca]ADO72349.1 conserved uncharacterized protein [Stigmatella aurantiaca DW4/3-1]EAU63110.1 hypothetical protein STIAU_6817 [Stigmatella aurantiaca DW4/3-1]
MPTQKKRPKRKQAKPPPERPRRARPSLKAGQASAVRAPGPLQYKVVELSTVDEGALERTVNQWVGQGWNLDGVQFAMRESSKRPAMAFVFFTREGAAATHDEEEARERLMRLSETGSLTAELAADHARVHAKRARGRVLPISAHERLAQLAGLDEAEPPERGLILEPEE